MITNLTSGRIKSHITRMAVPMVVGIFAVMVMNTVDTYFVSKLGVNELATMGYVVPVILVLFAITWGVATGASSIISRKLGSNSIDNAKSYVTYTILLAFIIGLIFAICGYLTIDFLFPVMGAEQKLLLYLHEYMDIWYLGCFFVVIQMVGNSMIRSFGNSRFPSILMIIMSVINLVLDPILIFGFWIIPAMGLKGAAIATIISYIIVFCISIYVMYFKMRIISYKYINFKIFNYWKNIFKIALPTIISNLTVPLSFMITIKLVSNYGTVAVGGLTIASRLESLAFIFLHAVSSVVTPIIGQNWGGELYDRVKKAMYIFFKFAFIWGITVTTILWLFASDITAWFSNDKAVISSAKLYLYIIPITYAFLAVNVIICGFANAVGKPKFALIFTLFRLFIIYIPLAYIFSNIFNLAGIYFAIAMSNVVVTIFSFRWWYIYSYIQKNQS